VSLEQEPKERSRVDGLDLAAQAIECAAMNPREQSPLTPLGAVGFLGEAAAQDEAFSFQLQ
jgi:hypothetical protein